MRRCQCGFGRILLAALLAAVAVHPEARRPIPPAPVVRRAFATADADDRAWSIGNGQIEARFRITAANDLVLDQLLNPETGRVLNSAVGFDSSVTIDGTAVTLGSATSGWTLDSVTASDEGGSARLSFTFGSSRTPLSIVRTYGCYTGSPTIEAWTTFQATSSRSVTVSNISVWQLTFLGNTVHYVLGLLNDAAGAPVDTAFTVQSAAVNGQFTINERNRSTATYLPAIAADTLNDEFFGGLLWSGSWEIAMQRVGASLRASAGIPGVSIAVDRAHPLETPHGFFGFTPSTRNDVSTALRSFVVQGIRGGRPFMPLVTYNTWFAYGTGIDDDVMREEMAAAASVGVEAFVIDAGWYLGAGSGTDFDSGLGTWQIDPGRFPNGLASLRSYAHDLGMQFGLWVEPERVDLATVDRPGLVREAWLARNNGSYQSSRSAQICLASPAARDWVIDRLVRLLDDVRPDYLKWDNNLWVNCNRSGHEHGTTDGNFAHVTGLYTVLQTLRDRYPGMAIENCSQGGNRLDFGMLRYSDTAWMDDRTSPAVHVRHNLQGLMTFFPPAYLLSIVVGDGNEPIVDAPDLPLYTRSRMPGVLGLTYRAADLTQMDRDNVAQEIAVYKRLREIVRDASGRLLTRQAQPDTGPSWDALQETSATTGAAVIFAFQNNAAVPRVHLRPEGLESGSRYTVMRANGTSIGDGTGADLMADGIEVDSSPESAAHVLLLLRDPTMPALAPVKLPRP